MLNLSFLQTCKSHKAPGFGEAQCHSYYFSKMAEFWVRTVEAGMTAQWLAMSTHYSCRGQEFKSQHPYYTTYNNHLWLQLEGLQLLLLASKSVPIHMHIWTLDKWLFLLQWALISGPLLRALQICYCHLCFLFVLLFLKQIACCWVGNGEHFVLKWWTMVVASNIESLDWLLVCAPHKTFGEIAICI